MKNCSIHIAAYHDFAGIDWDLDKTDGRWRGWRTGGHTWDEGGRWTAADDAIAESIIDNLVAEAMAKIDAVPELLEDTITLATDERDGITVDIYYHIPEEA